MTHLIRRGTIAALSAGAGLALVLGAGATAALAAGATPTPTSTGKAAATCTFGQELARAWGRDAGPRAGERPRTTGSKPTPPTGTAPTPSKTAKPTPTSGAAAKPKRTPDPAIAALRPFPSALTSDLAKLKGETPSARIATLDAIATKALAGDYGSKIQSYATSLKASNPQKCTTG